MEWLITSLAVYGGWKLISESVAALRRVRPLPAAKSLVPVENSRGQAGRMEPPVFHPAGERQAHNRPSRRPIPEPQMVVDGDLLDQLKHPTAITDFEVTVRGRTTSFQ